MTEKIEKIINVSEVAFVFGLSVAAFKEKLAQIGWESLISHAQKLAHIEAFNAIPSGRPTHFKFEPDLQIKHILAASESMLSVSQPTEPYLDAKGHGYLYVLYDAKTEQCKIGCTRSDSGKRQRSIMGAHGQVLANSLNAKVRDRFAAEAQCHKKFKDKRKNGEWFDVNVGEVIAYIHEHVEWDELDFECPSKMIQYIDGMQLDGSEIVKGKFSKNELPDAGKFKS